MNVTACVLLLAVLIPLAALGILGIAGAVTAHEASEIPIIASGVRMIRV